MRKYYEMNEEYERGFRDGRRAYLRNLDESSYEAINDLNHSIQNLNTVRDYILDVRLKVKVDKSKFHNRISKEIKGLLESDKSGRINVDYGYEGEFRFNIDGEECFRLACSIDEDGVFSNLDTNYQTEKFLSEKGLEKAFGQTHLDSVDLATILKRIRNLVMYVVRSLK